MLMRAAGKVIEGQRELSISPDFIFYLLPARSTAGLTHLSARCHCYAGQGSRVRRER